MYHTSSSADDKPWVRHSAQLGGKISMNLPPEDGICKKFEKVNVTLVE